MSLSKARTGIADIANTATFIGVIVAVVGFLVGKPVVAAVVVAGTLVTVLVHLVVRPPRGLGLLERRTVRSYLTRCFDRYCDDLPAGATIETGLTLADFLDGPCLYAEPTVNVVRGAPSNGFVCWITDAAAAGKSVLVLGDPGQGKTLSCQLAYLRLITAFKKDSRRQPIPVFIRLVDVRDFAENSRSESDGRVRLARLLKHGAHAVPLPEHRLRRLLKRRRIVFVLDGLDELAIHGGSVRDILPPVVQDVLDGPVVLTCRSAFYDLYVSQTPQGRGFDAVATLQGVDFERAGRQFVERYCQRFELPTAPALVELIGSSRSLQDIVTRPLILFMATDLLAHKLEGVPGNESVTAPEEWTVAEVYEQYVRKWLNLEQGKGAVLWHEMGDLCEAVAWRIFELAFDGGKAFGQYDDGGQDLRVNAANLRSVVDNWRDGRPRDITFSELTTRSFLLRTDDGEYYRFAHKSFFEFFVARRIRTTLTSRSSDGSLAEHLVPPLPDEVIDFLRQMLGKCDSVLTERTAIRENLFRVVETTEGARDHGTVMLRQQAANLLPIVLTDDPAGQRRLRQAHDRESHAFVRRGIAVGVALHLRDGSLMERLLDDFDHEPGALSFHMGYNRIYYGDQIPGTNGWRDDGLPQSDRFFRATLRHLENPFYEFIWPMSVRTAAVLLADVERRRYLETFSEYATQLGRLAVFAEAHVDDPCPFLAAESADLKELLHSLGVDGGADVVDEFVDGRPPAHHVGG